jgi:septum formation protein
LRALLVLLAWHEATRFRLSWLRFADVTEAEIAAYVATDEPAAMAGAFSLECLGAPFIAGIDGDPSNVVGLSLPLLRRMLAELNLPITSLWTKTVTS